MIIFFDLVFKHLQKMSAECQRNNIEVMRRMDPSNEFLFKDNTLITNAPNSDPAKLFEFVRNNFIKVGRRRKRKQTRLNVIWSPILTIWCWYSVCGISKRMDKQFILLIVTVLISKIMMLLCYFLTFKFSFNIWKIGQNKNDLAWGDFTIKYKHRNTIVHG